MDYFELTKQRCSYRGDYTSKKIPLQDIKLILSSALNAPSGCNAQTTEFVVVDDDKLIKCIGEILGKGNVCSAPALILCIVNKEPAPIIAGMSFETEDCSAAVMSMLLAITNLGYSSVWIDGQLRYADNAERIGSLINLPASKQIQVLLPVGEAKSSTTQPDKKSQEERVFFNSYSSNG